MSGSADLRYGTARIRPACQSNSCSRIASILGVCTAATRDSLRLSNAQLAAYSRLFSAAVLRELAGRGASKLFSRLCKEAGLDQWQTVPATVADAFDAAFSVLRSVSCRDEYVYKTALTQRVLLGKHSLNTASMLTEFRIGPCKADLVILNGTSTAYEIKSERDSLSRLNRQLTTYAKVFNTVYVIAAERFVADVLANSHADVGVLILSPQMNVQTVREAVARSDALCSLTWFDSLRTPEAANVLVQLGIAVPCVPNTLLRAQMRAIFEGLPAADVHACAVRSLKELRSLASLNNLVTALPASLATAALTTPLSQMERRVLSAAVATPFANAMAWA